MTAKGKKKPSRSQHKNKQATAQTQNEDAIEFPQELEATRLGFWPAREAIDPAFAGKPKLKLALRVLRDPSNTIEELQTAADLELEARAPSVGQRREDLFLSLLRAELVLSVYARHGQARGGETLDEVLQKFGFDDERALNLWARWRRKVPNELRKHSQEQREVVTFTSISTALTPKQGRARLAAIKAITKRRPDRKKRGGKLRWDRTRG